MTGPIQLPVRGFGKNLVLSELYRKLLFWTWKPHDDNSFFHSLHKTSDFRKFWKKCRHIVWFTVDLAEESPHWKLQSSPSWTDSAQQQSLQSHTLVRNSVRKLVQAGCGQVSRCFWSALYVAFVMAPPRPPFPLQLAQYALPLSSLEQRVHSR